MKTSERSTLAVAVLAAALTTAAHAQSWETMATVDDKTGGSWPEISASPTGLLLATTTHLDVPSTFVRRLYASTNQGVTWERIPDDASGFHPDRIVFTKTGDAVAIGDGGPLARSTNGGRNWTLVGVSDFYPVSFQESDAITVDGSGRIWVLGYTTAGPGTVTSSSDGGLTWNLGGLIPDGNLRTIAVSSTAVIVSGRDSAGWATWRSIDGGATWDQVDSFELDTSNPTGRTLAKSAAADSQGRFYVVGQAMVGSSPRWIARGSSDGGLTWTTLDDFYESYVSGPTSYATAVTVTPQDGIYVIGYSLWDVTGSSWNGPTWRVRASSNGGQTWQTTDGIALAGNPTVAPTIAHAFDVTSDPAGNVFVIGDYAVGFTGPASVPRAIVRRLLGPPQLALSIQQGQIRVSWPTNYTGFVLQSATTLSNGGDWHAAGLTPGVVGDRNVVTVDTTNAAAFFRLSQP